MNEVDESDREAQGLMGGGRQHEAGVVIEPRRHGR